MPWFWSAWAIEEARFSIASPRPAKTPLILREPRFPPEPNARLAEPFETELGGGPEPGLALARASMAASTADGSPTAWRCCAGSAAAAGANAAAPSSLAGVVGAALRSEPAPLLRADLGFLAELIACAATTAAAGDGVASPWMNERRALSAESTSRSRPAVLALALPGVRAAWPEALVAASFSFFSSSSSPPALLFLPVLFLTDLGDLAASLAGVALAGASTTASSATASMMGASSATAFFGLAKLGTATVTSSLPASCIGSAYSKRKRRPQMEMTSPSMSILDWSTTSSLSIVPPGLVLLRFCTHTRESSSALSIACCLDTSGLRIVTSHFSSSLKHVHEGEKWSGAGRYQHAYWLKKGRARDAWELRCAPANDQLVIRHWADAAIRAVLLDDNQAAEQILLVLRACGRRVSAIRENADGRRGRKGRRRGWRDGDRRSSHHHFVLAPFEIAQSEVKENGKKRGVGGSGPGGKGGPLSGKMREKERRPSRRSLCDINVVRRDHRRLLGGTRWLPTPAPHDHT